MSQFVSWPWIGFVLARGRSFNPTTVIGKATPPFCDDAWLNAHFPGDRTHASALGCEQHDLRPLHVARRRASST
jgi:hypothetical protein